MNFALACLKRQKAPLYDPICAHCSLVARIIVKSHKGSESECSRPVTCSLQVWVSAVQVVGRIAAQPNTYHQIAKMPGEPWEFRAWELDAGVLGISQGFVILVFGKFRHELMNHWMYGCGPLHLIL